MPDPDLLLQAISHARADRYAQAEGLLQTALEAEPDDAYALFLLGECALATGRPAEAVGLLARALAMRPAHRDGRLALARAHLAACDPSAALDTLEALAGDTSLASAQSLRGTALNALGRPTEAVVAFAHALALRPEDAEAHLNCGNALADLDDLDGAEQHIRRATAYDPLMPEAHASLGHLLARMGRLPEAIAAGAEAIALRPDFAVAHWNQGFASLLAGDMAAGWPEYEWRKQRFPGSFAGPPGPQWDGAAIQGRTILVVAEQGFGDAIQFARYLPLLVRRGARVVAQCAAPMVPLLAAIPGVEAVPRGPRPDHDCWVDQMSLPLLFGTTLATVPSPAGYLAPDPARAARWDERLQPGLRVGLVWAGNPLHSNDRRRSLSVAALAPVVSAGRSALVSLQVGPRARDMAKLFGVADHSGRLTDWAETAALLSVMDLVIAVDTAVAHLAGALGIPVWLMLPHAPDWRWMLGRDDSPWYAGTRLFRQERPGDWAGVVNRVAAALAAVVQPTYSMAMPPLTWRVAPVTHPASADAR